MRNSLWPDIEDVPVVDNNSLSILEEQASSLSELTRGKIKCLFEKIHYNETVTNTIGMFASALSSQNIRSEHIEEEIKGKIDFKENLNKNKGRYKFEVYNDSYHYRLFTYSYSFFYPNSIDIDDGICEELKLSNNILINSDEELKNYLKVIFNSRSVKLALSKMSQQPTH